MPNTPSASTRRANADSFKPGPDVRRHKFSREECVEGGRRGFWAALESITVRYDDDRAHLRQIPQKGREVRMKITDPLRPCCATCRRPLKRTGGATYLRWRCSGCGFEVVPRRSRRRHWGTPPPKRAVHPFPVEIVARPCCLKCRREMLRQGGIKNGRVYVNWLCRHCHVTVMVAPVRRPPDTSRKPGPDDPRPGCCGRPMQAHGWSGRGRRWLCTVCRHRHHDRAPRLTEADACALLDSLTLRLPAYLPEDAREDARQSIMLAILEGAACFDMDAGVIKAHARAALGPSQNRFKFLSLDAPIPGTDGLTWAETLIG